MNMMVSFKCQCDTAFKKLSGCISECPVGMCVGDYLDNHSLCGKAQPENGGLASFPALPESKES